MTYSEKLKHPEWQKKRLKIMERDGFACRECGDTGTTLHVHHRFYISGREPWGYPDQVLITLCKDCHAKTGEQFIAYWTVFDELALTDGLSLRVISDTQQELRRQGYDEDQISDLNNMILKMAKSGELVDLFMEHKGIA